VIEANGTAYMAMPYYQAETLKEKQARDPKHWTEAELNQLLNPLLDTLSLLHEH
jgi:hypothetical protein